METNKHISKKSRLWKKGDKLLKAAHKYWLEYQKTCEPAAVVWLNNSNGHFVLFTRFEYKAKILQNVFELYDEKPLNDPFIFETEDKSDNSIADEILKNIGDERERYKVIGVIGDIAVLEEVIEPTFPRVPFIVSIKKDGKWEPFDSHYASIDHALLGALGYKYIGPHSNFEMFASKMLGLDKE